MIGGLSNGMSAVARTLTSGKTITLDAGHHREGLELVIPAMDGVISGTVVDSSGVPVEDVLATAWLQYTRGEMSPAMAMMPREPPALTDHGGQFRLRGLPPGHYTVRVYRQDGEGVNVIDVEPGVNKTITLPPAVAP